MTTRRRALNRLAAPGIIVAAAALTLTGLGLGGCQEETPAEDALPLREIVQAVEGREYGPIAEISYEDGLWQIEAYQAGSPVHLDVDPTGEKGGTVVAERPREDAEADEAPPAGSLALSKIIENLESEGYTNVTAVDFEDKDPPRWEIEALKNGEPHEVDVNPATGEIIAFRPEDFDG